MAKKSRNTSGTTILDGPRSHIPKANKSSKKGRKPNQDHTPIAKHSDELELEKLVFGDLSGFQKSLRSNGVEGGYLSAGSGDELNVAAGEEEGAGPGRDLTALADDEVGPPIWFRLVGLLAKISSSYFLQMLALAMLILRLYSTRIPCL